MRKHLLLPLLLLLCTFSISAQVSSSNARRVRSGTSLPATCNPGPSWTDVFWKTDTDIWYACSATNTWKVAGAGGTVTSVTGTSPIASSGGATPAISLNDTAVAPGSYTSANITVDAKGRLTAAASGSGATPGGSDTQVQFNDATAFGGDAGLVYNKTTDVLTAAGGLVVSGSNLGIGTNNLAAATQGLIGGTSYNAIRGTTTYIQTESGGATVATFTAATAILEVATSIALNAPAVTSTGSIFAGGSATGDTSTSQGVFMGFNTTPRILLNNGTAAQNRAIDQNGGTFRLYNAQNGDIYLTMTGTTFTVGNNQTLATAGNITVEKTITTAGTTGAQTINKIAGSVNFAAAATSLVVTDSRVDANSVILCTVATNDTTMKSVQCVAGSGSFTMFANAAANAETRVNFLVLN